MLDREMTEERSVEDLDDDQDWIDATRENERAGVGFVEEIDADRDTGTVHVEIELPHGEQTFSEEFYLTRPGRKSLDNLFRAVGLDPRTDSVDQLVGREVAVTRKKSAMGASTSWKVQLEERDRLSLDHDKMKHASNLSQIAGQAGLIWASLIGFAFLFGGMSVVPALPLIALGVALRLTGEAGFVSLQMQSSRGEVRRQSVRTYERYLRGDVTIPGLAFHLFTGGYFLD